MRAFASIMDFLLKRFRGYISGFLTGSFLRGGVFNPTPNPQPGGTGPIFITPGTGWPSYTPRHCVPILVAFYVMHKGGIQAKGIWKQDPEANIWTQEEWEWEVEEAL